MSASQLLIAYALISGTPQPLVVEFPPACSTCPVPAPTAFLHAAPVGGVSPVLRVSPVIEVPLLSLAIRPIDPCIAKRCRAEKHRTTGDMYPSCTLMPPACHGSYYFRPYNVSTIGKQQAIVQGWGEDPRMPYTTRLFEMLYANHCYPPVFCPPGDCTPPPPAAHSPTTVPSFPPPAGSGKHQPSFRARPNVPIIPQSYEDPFVPKAAPSDHFSAVR